MQNRLEGDLAAQFEEAVDRLRDGILRGDHRPGEKLVASDIAASLGMSRTPVREAFRVLSMEGLLELSSNRGARVAIWDDAQLDAVFDTRVTLEGLACRRAAELATDEQIARLEELAVAIRDLGMPTASGMLAIQQLNGEFHALVLTAASSDTLSTAMSGVLHAAVLNRTRGAYDEVAQRRSAEHHLEIVAALRARDGRWAEAVMTSHLLAARAALLGPRRAPDADADDLRDD